MTRKDYEIIASVLSASKPTKRTLSNTENANYSVEIFQWRCLVEDFAFRLRSNNSNFKNDKFLKACDYTEV